MSDTTSTPLLLLISAPSGGGKTTVCEQLLSTTPSLTRIITCTTRPPRAGERDGVDYYFLTPEVFAAKVTAGEFAEHATVYGRSYGTLKAELIGRLRQGKDVLLNIDVQGAETIRSCAATEAELGRALVTVFLTPPSLGVLEERLRKRGKDLEEVIQERLGAARLEVAQWRRFDYLVLSSSVAEDLRRMQVIYEAERMRQNRTTPPAL